MSRLVRRIGPLDFVPASDRTLFAAMTRAVARPAPQPGRRPLHPEQARRLPPIRTRSRCLRVLALPDTALRSAGLSATKAATIRELASKTVDHTLPSPARLLKMSDDQIIAELTAIKGIGRWTVEMFLIFTLGRPDVLPAGDLGVRKGFALSYRSKELPAPKELLAFGEKWRPYRTTATLYLYEAVHVPEPIPGVKLVRNTRPKTGGNCIGTFPATSRGGMQFRA